ncbi:MAG: hypothetical protein C5B47_05680 [Verrucomicrobia bacterium]|nr:MAG: hypothetical protein C5B47_05680 [Verrucomicrobiota bacterium]
MCDDITNQHVLRRYLILPLLRRRAFAAVVSLFFTSITSAFAIPYPRSTVAPPPECYLDIPFLPQETGLNRLMFTLDDHGVKPFVKYWGDFLSNPVGGISQAADWFQLLVYGVRLDLARLMHWPGGEFTLSAIDSGGDDLQGDVGTLFTPAQVVTVRGSALFLLYFTQHLFEDVLELKVGRASTGAFYARLPVMGLPVSGAVNGNPISLLYNASGFHATGKSNWMANVKVKPTKEISFQTGIFQVTTQRMNKHWFNGVDFSFRRGDGIILVSEAGWSPAFFAEQGAVQRSCPEPRGAEPFEGLLGLYQLGGYYQNYPMLPLLQSDPFRNVYGFYFQGQQMVWRSREYQNLNVTIWGGITYSPQQQIALMPLMAYGGVAWAGLFPYREHDQLLLNFYLGGYSRDYSRSFIAAGEGSRTLELTFEVSYIFQITRQIQFQPDLQWFIQPGGARNIPNALVLGFQVAFVY